MTVSPFRLGIGLGRHAALLPTTLFALIPFIWMVSLSVKPPNEIFGSPFALIPQHWDAYENYSKALSTAPLARFMVNGAIVCFAILALQILFCAPCAYALAKLKFPGRNLLLALVLVGLLLPHQVLALPLFILCYKLGILNTYAALILPFIISPFGIFLFRQSFKSIPDDIVQAARLDGLSELAIVWRIMVPMALPATIAFSIFSVVAHWNDLFWPSIVIKSKDLMPPSLGAAAFRSVEAGSDFGPLMAGAVLIILPLLLAFVLAQRWFIEGLASSSLK
ncbi:carbohydrate ABC transporter permease [Rhizobium jaguaris]|uniref:Carbohydrate ABC transporter permease n=1 Tax=Rhizobium jaguaris TaxID=1312183 RepID=A0A387G1M4_9HYPH|nr:carbohydrate ABC transporter permease [Rhizobium jaguaris]AYG62091.1 carbohydrate ABC transporter permease [Rhizobium jaguaris]